MAKLLKESDLFVVQLQDTIHSDYVNDVVSVTFDTLKDSIVDLAIPGTRDGGYSDGRAGVMYPGQGFYYDESDGRLDVRVDSDLKFIGVITEDETTASGYTEYDPSYATATGDPVVARGNFFVVGVELPTGLPADVWYPVAGSELASPQLGDLVVCVDDSVPGSTEGEFDSHAWNVIPNVTGGQAVLEIRASAPKAENLSVNDLLKQKERYVEVNTAAPIGSNQRPVVRVRQAGFIEVPGDTVLGGYYVGGLIDEHDKQKLDQFDLNLFQGGFVKSLNLRTEKSTTDSLRLDSVGNFLQPEYPQLILSSNPAEENKYGVIPIASQQTVGEAVRLGYGQGGDDSISGLIDSVAMTPLKTINNFVPRLFNTLPNLETAAQAPLP